MFILSNLLIGQLPDAVGLLVFGLAMVLSSIVIRRLVGEDKTADTNDTGLEERV